MADDTRNDALREERLRFEQRSQKVLAILTRKDEEIVSWQSKAQAFQRQLRETQESLQAERRAHSQCQRQLIGVQEVLKSTEGKLTRTQAREQQLTSILQDLELSGNSIGSDDPQASSSPGSDEVVRNLRRKVVDQSQQIDVLVEEIAHLREQDEGAKPKPVAAQRIARDSNLEKPEPNGQESVDDAAASKQSNSANMGSNDKPSVNLEAKKGLSARQELEFKNKLRDRDIRIRNSENKVKHLEKLLQAAQTTAIEGRLRVKREEPKPLPQRDSFRQSTHTEQESSLAVVQVDNSAKIPKEFEFILKKQAEELISVRKQLVDMTRQFRCAVADSKSMEKKLQKEVKQLKRAQRCHQDDGIIQKQRMDTTIRVLSGRSDLHAQYATVAANARDLHTKLQSVETMNESLSETIRDLEKQLAESVQQCIQLETEVMVRDKALSYTALDSHVQALIHPSLVMKLESYERQLELKRDATTISLQNATMSHESHLHHDTQTENDSQNSLSLLSTVQFKDLLNQVMLRKDNGATSEDIGQAAQKLFRHNQLTVRKLEAAETNIQSLRDQISQIQAQSNTQKQTHAQELLCHQQQCKEQLLVIARRISAQVRELRIANEERDDVQTKLDATQLRIREVVADSKHRIARLTEHQESLVSQLEDVRRQNRALLSQVQHMTNEVAKSEGQVAVLIESLNTLDSNFQEESAYQKEVDASIVAISDGDVDEEFTLQRKWKGMSSRVCMLTLELIQSKDKEVAIQHELEKALQRIQQLNEDRVASSTKLFQLRQDISKLRETNATLNVQHEQDEKKLADSQTEMDEVKLELHQTKLGTIELETIAKKRQAELQSFQENAKNQIENMFQRLQSETTSLRSQIADQKKALALVTESRQTKEHLERFRLTMLKEASDWISVHNQNTKSTTGRSTNALQMNMFEGTIQMILDLESKRSETESQNQTLEWMVQSLQSVQTSNEREIAKMQNTLLHVESQLSSEKSAQLFAKSLWQQHLESRESYLDRTTNNLESLIVQQAKTIQVLENAVQGLEEQLNGVVEDVEWTRQDREHVAIATKWDLEDFLQKQNKQVRVPSWLANARDSLKVIVQEIVNESTMKKSHGKGGLGDKIAAKLSATILERLCALEACNGVLQQKLSLATDVNVSLSTVPDARYLVKQQWEYIRNIEPNSAETWPGAGAKFLSLLEQLQQSKRMAEDNQHLRRRLHECQVECDRLELQSKELSNMTANTTGFNNAGFEQHDKIVSLENAKEALLEDLHKMKEQLVNKTKEYDMLVVRYEHLFQEVSNASNNEVDPLRSSSSSPAIQVVVELDRVKEENRDLKHQVEELKAGQRNDFHVSTVPQYSLSSQNVEEQRDLSMSQLLRETQTAPHAVSSSSRGGNRKVVKTSKSRVESSATISRNSKSSRLKSVIRDTETRELECKLVEADSRYSQLSLQCAKLEDKIHTLLEQANQKDEQIEKLSLKLRNIELVESQNQSLSIQIAMLEGQMESLRAEYLVVKQQRSSMGQADPNLQHQQSNTLSVSSDHGSRQVPDERSNDGDLVCTNCEVLKQHLISMSSTNRKLLNTVSGLQSTSPVSDAMHKQPVSSVAKKTLNEPATIACDGKQHCILKARLDETLQELSLAKEELEHTKSECELTVKLADESRRRLQTQVEVRNEEAESQNELVDATQRELKEVTATLSERDKVINELESRVKAMTENTVQLEILLEQKEDEFNKYVVAAEEKISCQHDDLEKIQLELKSVEAHGLQNIEKAERGLEEAKQKRKKVEGELSRLKTKLNEMTQTRDELIRVHRAELKQLKETWHSPESWNKLNNKTKRLSSRIEALNRAQTIQKSATKRSPVVASSDKKLSTKKSKITSSDKLAEKEIPLVEETAEIGNGNMDKELEKLKNRVRQMERDTNMKEKLIQDLRSRLNDSNSKLESANDNIRKLEEKVKQLLREKQTLNDWKAKVKSLEQKLEINIQELEKAQARGEEVEKLRIRLRKASGNVSDLNRKLQEANEAILSEKEAHQNGNKDKVQRNKQVRKSTIEFKSRLNETSTALEKSKKNCLQLEQNIQQLVGLLQSALWKLLDDTVAKAERTKLEKQVSMLVKQTHSAAIKANETLQHFIREVRPLQQDLDDETTSHHVSSLASVLDLSVGDAEDIVKSVFSSEPNMQTVMSNPGLPTVVKSVGDAMESAIAASVVTQKLLELHPRNISSTVISKLRDQLSVVESKGDMKSINAIRSVAQDILIEVPVV